MSDKPKQNLGAAHLYIELKNNHLFVYHGDNKELLFSRNAYEGTWENLFKVLKGNKQ